MKYPQLADRVRYFKEDERGVAVMCKAMEDMRNETDVAARRKMAMKLLQDGTMSLEKIAEIAEFTVEEVRELEREKNPNI